MPRSEFKSSRNSLVRWRLDWLVRGPDMALGREVRASEGGFTVGGGTEDRGQTQTSSIRNRQKSVRHGFHEKKPFGAFPGFWPKNAIFTSTSEVRAAKERISVDAYRTPPPQPDAAADERICGGTRSEERAQR